jgi:hypothetical protein
MTKNFPSSLKEALTTPIDPKDAATAGHTVLHTPVDMAIGAANEIGAAGSNTAEEIRSLKPRALWTIFRRLLYLPGNVVKASLEPTITNTRKAAYQLFGASSDTTYES